MLKYVVGDATQPIGDGLKVIAHVCNDIGAWGAGFVMALSARWPQPEKDYREWFLEEFHKPYLGAISAVNVEDDIWVANMIAQHKVGRDRNGRPPIRYDALQMALQALHGLASNLGATVHMPRIGAGLAGGDWIRIEQLIINELVDKNIQVTVYDLA